MSLKMDNIVCGRRSICQITRFRKCLFLKTINIFCNLKLEIVLAIPASNDKKYNKTNSAGQGLTSLKSPRYFNIYVWFIVTNLDESYESYTTLISDI